MSFSQEILRALEAVLPADNAQIRSIERLDMENLNNSALGESFANEKYDLNNNKLIGFNPVRIHYSLEKNDHYFDITIKGHEPGAFVDNIIPEAFRKCHLDFDMPYQDTYTYREFQYLFEGEYHYYDLVQPFLKHSNLIPKYYGRYHHKNGNRNYIFIELVRDIKHINEWLLADDWSDDLFTAVIQGLSELHAPFYNKQNDSNYQHEWLVGDLNFGKFRLSNPLWMSMLNKLIELYPSLITDEVKKFFLNVVNTANDWHGLIDRLPKTVIHGDFNPRNFGFTTNNGDYQLLALDWECIRWGIPQYDLAQFLLHSCSEETIIDKTHKYVFEYWQALQRKLNINIDKKLWLQGFDAAVKSHFVNRATILMIIGHSFWPDLPCFGQRMFTNAVKILTSDRLNFMRP